jgi:hypothetical protein
VKPLALALAHALALALALGVGCGGEGVDPCANDACVPQGRTVVKWTFNAYPDRGFAMDSCVDFGVHKVAVDLVDIDGFATSGIDDCGAAQATFSGLAPGEYDVYVMPLDAGGNGLIAAPITGKVTAGAVGAPTDLTVNVPWDSWLGTFTGTFLFRIAWGGLSCEATTPAIKDQKLTLTVNGVVQEIATDDGQMLNGADKKPCKKLTDEFPQSALKVPFGPATLLVEGYDDADNMPFSKQFDTFIGAGITNPTLTFDVPTL